MMQEKKLGEGKLAGEGLGPHLVSVSSSPCFDSWLPVKIPGVCIGKLQQSMSLSYLRIKRNEYLPVLRDEEFNPPWRL